MTDKTGIEIKGFELDNICRDHQETTYFDYHGSFYVHDLKDLIKKPLMFIGTIEIKSDYTTTITLSIQNQLSAVCNEQLHEAYASKINDYIQDMMCEIINEMDAN